MNEWLFRLAKKIVNRRADTLVIEISGGLHQPELSVCYRCGKSGTLVDGLHSYDTYILCKDCATPWLQREILRLRTAKCRSRKYNTHYDIQLLEWIQTLVDFDGRCAYCGAKHSMTLDHFIPLELGGETVIENLLPACSRCNSRKGSLWPSQIKFITDERMQQLADYLQSRARANEHFHGNRRPA